MSLNIPTLINSLNLPHFESIDELSELTRLSSRLLYFLSMKTDKYQKTKRIKKGTAIIVKFQFPHIPYISYNDGF